MIFPEDIDIFQIYIFTQRDPISSVPAQSNVALLVDKLVLGGQTFQSIVGDPASVAVKEGVRCKV